MRAYRALLHLYPASFRAEYGAEMCAIFARARRDASGVLGRAGSLDGGARRRASERSAAHVDILRQDLQLHGAHAAALARLHRHRDRGGGPRHRRHHRGLLDHRPRARAAAAVSRARSAGERSGRSSPGYSRSELSPANYRDWKRKSRSFEAHGRLRDRVREPRGRRRAGAARRREGHGRPVPPAGHAARCSAASSRRPTTRRALPRPSCSSYGLWQSRFGGDPAVLGRTVLLDDAPYVVIGVMPRGFLFPNRETQVWISMRFVEDDFADRDNNYLRTHRPAPRPRCPSSRRARRCRSWPRSWSAPIPRRTSARAPRRAHPRRGLRAGAPAPAGAVRARRSASCSSRAPTWPTCCSRARCSAARSWRCGRRSARDASASCASCSRRAWSWPLCGGVLGVLLAVAATPLVARLVPNTLPIAETPHADLRVLAFAALATVVTGIGFGVVPALRAQRAWMRAACGKDRARGWPADRERLGPCSSSPR